MGLDLVAGTVIAYVGIPGLAPLPPSHILFVLVYAFSCSLLLNDLIKYVLIAKVGIVGFPNDRHRPGPDAERHSGSRGSERRVEGALSRWRSRLGG